MNQRHVRVEGGPSLGRIRDDDPQTPSPREPESGREAERGVGQDRAAGPSQFSTNPAGRGIRPYRSFFGLPRKPTATRGSWENPVRTSGGSAWISSFRGMDRAGTIVVGRQDRSEMPREIDPGEQKSAKPVEARPGSKSGRTGPSPVNEQAHGLDHREDDESGDRGRRQRRVEPSGPRVGRTKSHHAGRPPIGTGRDRA